ncbi:TadE/TadG family type IV pilus assembly protein [Actinophytocola sp.]|uniref:TadE/TadG family type IV pilus assembly protein n=1 Tax=Actinophytocola sp. TaxID=1872138 RepID=UPI003D6C029E
MSKPVKRWWRSDRGSASAELTLITPLLIMVLMFVAVVIHRGVDARLRLDDVAHQAARAASAERTSATAVHAARATAGRGLAEAGVVCASTTVAADTADFRPGGTLTVTVTCAVDFGDGQLLGVPTNRTVTATATEPVDAWRSGPTTGTTT